jgi:ABC-type branched-subunit amino acid transport system substrate-binding protein
VNTIGIAIAAVMSAGLSMSACGSTSNKTSSGSGSTSKTIVLGADAPETGPSSSVLALASGADAYFKTIDAQGGINGYKFQYDIVDDQFNPALAVSAARKLVQQDQVFAMVGGVGTNTQLAISSFLQSQGVPNIGPASTDPNVANALTYMTVATATEDGAYQAQYAVNQLAGGKPVGALYENDSVGQPYLDAYNAVAAKSNATMSAVSFATGATDFTAQVSRLKSSGASVVMIAGAASALLPAMKTADSLDYTPKWVVTAYDTTPALLASLPTRQRLNMYFSSAVPLSGTPATAEIDAAVQKYEPTIAAGNNTTVGWVTGSVFAEAFRQITNNGGAPTRPRLVAALNKLSNYSNAWVKDITYTASAEVKQPHVPRVAESMIGYVNGALAVVSPFTQPAKISSSGGQ